MTLYYIPILDVMKQRSNDTVEKDKLYIVNQDNVCYFILLEQETHKK